MLERPWEFEAVYGEQLLFNFIPGMKLHSCLAIELWCGRIDYAIRGVTKKYREDKNWIEGVDASDRERRKSRPPRYDIPFNGAMQSIGDGSYRSNVFSIGG